MTVAPEVALDWERGEGEVRLVLRSDADLPTAFAAMTAVSEQVRTVEIEMWEPTALPFAVGLYVVMDPPQYDAVLDGLVAGLEARGISGVLSSHGPRADDPRHPLDDERLAYTTEVTTCRVSVVGQPSPPLQLGDGSLGPGTVYPLAGIVSCWSIGISRPGTRSNDRTRKCYEPRVRTFDVC